WNPYVVAGLGYQRNEEEYDAFPSPDSPAQIEDGNIAAKIGAGIQTALGNRVKVRGELAYRLDFNDDSYAASGGPDWNGYPHSQEESYFGDLLASIGVVIPLGPEPTAPVAPAPAPAAPSCADMDS